MVVKFYKKLKTKNNEYVLTITFVNYLREKSGVPKVMMAHQQLYNKQKISYLALFPVKKNICNDRFMVFCKYGLIVDGEFQGIYQMSQILQMLANLNNSGKKMLDIHIHHLLYNKTELIDELLGAFYQVPIKVYLHDYYNACSNYNLMINERSYCGGLGLKEKYCDKCPSFNKSSKIQNKIHTLYKKNIERITFISPSETTRSIYMRFHPEYKNQIVVIPHQVFYERYHENLEKLVSNEKIKVAFLGMPSSHKGWEVWEKIVNDASKEQFEFIVFNSSDNVYKGMSKEKVCFSKEDLNAMTDALRRIKVHIVVLWSLCPETYSYTCFEAFSSNAFLITSQTSGNIADVVENYDCGLVLKNEYDLYVLFQNPSQLINLVNSYREKTVGGPAILYENNKIVKLTQIAFDNDNVVAIKPVEKIVNLPLLWLLNFLYKKGFIYKQD